MFLFPPCFRAVHDHYLSGCTIHAAGEPVSFLQVSGLPDHPTLLREHPVDSVWQPHHTVPKPGAFPLFEIFTMQFSLYFPPLKSQQLISDEMKLSSGWNVISHPHNGTGHPSGPVWMPIDLQDFSDKIQLFTWASLTGFTLYCLWKCKNLLNVQISCYTVYVNECKCTVSLIVSGIITLGVKLKHFIFHCIIGSFPDQKAGGHLDGPWE